MKSLIKKGLFWSISKSKVHKLLEPIFGGMGVILMFHRVLPDARRSQFPLNRNIEISPRSLEKIIDYFEGADFDFVHLDECWERLIGKPTDRRFVVFTFDDGYLDNYEFAYPILKRREVPFTVYVACRFPDRGMPVWWYALEQLIMEREQVSFNLHGKEFMFPSATEEEKHSCYSSIHQMILSADGMRGYKQLLEEIFLNWEGNLCDLEETTPMSWQILSDLSKDELVTIGAHSMLHAPLTSLSKIDSHNEILQSKEVLEKKIGLPIRHFDYPYGMHGSKEREIARNIGFRTATTTWPGNLHKAHQHSLEALPRIAISDETLDGDYLEQMLSGLRPYIDNSFAKVMAFD